MGMHDCGCPLHGHLRTQLKGRLPFKAKDQSGLFKAIVKGVYDPLSDSCSAPLKQIMKGMLMVNPAERITMLELRHSPWCEGLDCEDALEEPLAGDSAGDEDLEESQQDGSGSLEDTISSSLQLVLPSDFAPSRVNSGMFAESQEGDDGASVSSGIDTEEESVAAAASRGAGMTSTLRKKGLTTPPVTPGGSRGAGSRSIFASDGARKTSGGPSDVPRPMKQVSDSGRKPSKSMVAGLMSSQGSGKLTGSLTSPVKARRASAVGSSDLSPSPSSKSYTSQQSSQRFHVPGDNDTTDARSKPPPSPTSIKAHRV
ncbi:hypothetical protein ABBQ32_005928 [Trebouxia sp. C0010 RCD-2024]